jgi:hypothetical protein
VAPRRKSGITINLTGESLAASLRLSSSNGIPPKKRKWTNNKKNDKKIRDKENLIVKERVRKKWIKIIVISAKISPTTR